MGCYFGESCPGTEGASPAHRGGEVARLRDPADRRGPGAVHPHRELQGGGPCQAKDRISWCPTIQSHRGGVLKTPPRPPPREARPPNFVCPQYYLFHSPA